MRSGKDDRTDTVITNSSFLSAGGVIHGTFQGDQSPCLQEFL